MFLQPIKLWCTFEGGLEDWNLLSEKIGLMHGFRSRVVYGPSTLHVDILRISFIEVGYIL